jgi:hypothetical protein
MTKGGQRGWGKASRKQTTQQRGGGGRRREASRRQTTQQEGCHRSGGRWWNPPVQASTNVDSFMLQLPLRRENEGQEPIVIKAAEQSTMMEVDGEMTARRAKPARRQRLLTWATQQQLCWQTEGDGLAVVAGTRRLDNQP